MSVSAPEAFKSAIWRRDVGAGELVGLFSDDARALACDRTRQAGQHVEAELRVLVEDGNACFRLRRHDGLAVDVALAAVALEEAHRPRVPREAAADRLRAVACVQLRHLLRVQVVADREVVRRADRVEDGEHPVLLDEPACELDGLRRVISVVHVAVLDLPAVDAALRVHVVEVGLRARPDRPEGGCLSCQRNGATEQNGRRRDTWVGRGGAAGACDESERHERDSSYPRDHLVTSVRSPGSLRTAVPTRARALCAIGRSR